MIDNQAEQRHRAVTGRGGGLKNDLNVPWVESPFFEAELASRDDLEQDQKELLSHYSRYGYITLEHIASNEMVERVKHEVAGLFDPKVREGPVSHYRVQDAWERSAAVRELALNEKVLATLRLLYGREPVPFQTLNFLLGSEQAAHPDAPLFNSLPARYMCGVWVALEDVDRENGPLFYYPESHKLPEFYPDDFRHVGDNPDAFFNQRYYPFMQELMKARDFSFRELHIRKGSALIWASNLVHGGMPRLDKSRTRWSQVTHYFFKDCIYYVPLYSNGITGEIFLRNVHDFRGNGRVGQTYNGVPFHATPIGSGRFRISFEAESVADPASARPAAKAIARLGGEMSILRLARRLRSRFLSRGSLFSGSSQPSVGDARSDVLSVEESREVIFHVDSFEEKAASVSIVGWVFLRGTSAAEGGTIQVALRSERDCYLVDCQRMGRPDVAAAHRLTYSDCGFQLLLEKRSLSPGRYKIGLVIKHHGQDSALRFTDLTVNVG